MDQIEALRTAAGALIAAAEMPVVKAVLRQLLDGADAATTRPPARIDPPSRVTPKPLSATTQPSPTSPRDPAWLDLRQRVKAAKAARGIGNAELAAEIGMAKMTVLNVVSSNRSPTKAMMVKLEAWLAEQAPEVAASAVTFRPNGHGAAYAGTDVGIEAGNSTPAGD